MDILFNLGKLMSKVLLFISILFLNSCSIYNLQSSSVLNKVTVVTSSLYLKHNQAYFQRNNLIPFSNQKKYRFFYRKKTREMGVLLHRSTNRYYFYNLTKSETKPLIIYSKSSSDKNVYSLLAKRGFYKTNSPEHYGYKLSVNFRKLQGVKTLFIQAYNYRKLQKVYQNAIKNYSAKSLKNIKTKLPKSIIYPYYNKYKKLTEDKEKLFQLGLISKKLFQYKIQKNYKINTSKHPKQPIKIYPDRDISKTNKESKKSKKLSIIKDKEISINKNISPEKEEDLLYADTSAEFMPLKSSLPSTAATTETNMTESKYKSFNYYSKQANINILPVTYAAKENKKISPKKQNNPKSKERNILRDGSLKELISAYKQNKNPLYKQKIMKLIKEEKKNN